jgi:hypothetical protein
MTIILLSAALALLLAYKPSPRVRRARAGPRLHLATGNAEWLPRHLVVREEARFRAVSVEPGGWKS